MGRLLWLETVVLSPGQGTRPRFKASKRSLGGLATATYVYGPSARGSSLGTVVHGRQRRGEQRVVASRTTLPVLLGPFFWPSEYGSRAGKAQGRREVEGPEREVQGPKSQGPASQPVGWLLDPAPIAMVAEVSAAKSVKRLPRGSKPSCQLATPQASERREGAGALVCPRDSLACYKQPLPLLVADVAHGAGMNTTDLGGPLDRTPPTGPTKKSLSSRGYFRKARDGWTFLSSHWPLFSIVSHESSLST